MKKTIGGDSFMFCDKCGAELSEEDKFCPNCGKRLDESAGDNIKDNASKLIKETGGSIDTEKLKGAASAASKKLSEGKEILQSKIEQGKEFRQKQAEKIEQNKELKEQLEFVSPDEKVLATLGSGYVQNALLGKSLKKGFATLTDKRLYYKGKSFSNANSLKNISSFTEESIVSVEDISLTRFVYKRKFGLLLISLLLFCCGAWLFLIGANLFSYDIGYFYIEIMIYCVFGGILLAAGIVGLIKSFLNKKTYFQIAFPGGVFMFDLVYYPIAEVRDFQKQLHLVKQSIKRDK